MARSPRRMISTFSLSFLDIMFCGFGAVVLLVLIINTHTLSRRGNRVSEVETELNQAAMEQRIRRAQVERQRSEVHNLQMTSSRLEDGRQSMMARLSAAEARTAAAAAGSVDDEIDRLKNQLNTLESDVNELIKQQSAERERGRQVRAIVGPGNRQYLTGLKLDGERVLILVDSSASMLDTRIVEVVRRKVLNERSRRSAPKWQKVVATVEWLVANLPPTSAVRIHHFNTSVTQVSTGETEPWVPVTSFGQIDEVIEELKMVAPLGGTNLETPLLEARSLTPRPDNIILITDGLPTQGKRGARSNTIDGKGRVKLFRQAVRNLPPNIPVNTILFPMEGDPLAASLYWKLALESGGSFFTPTRDWP